MENFSSGGWFANRKKFNFQDFTVEGIDFQLIPLTDDLIEDIKNAGSLEETLFLAAEYGISVGRDRIFDDEVMANDIDCFWALPEINVGEPLVQYQVGLKVCEISGLTDYIETVKEVDKEQKAAEDLAELQELGHVDGDKNTPDVLLDQLNNDVNTVSVTNTL